MMAGGQPLSEAFVDVGMRFTQFDKDLQELEKKTRSKVKQIEDSFMVKYTKGFTGQVAARAEEGILKRRFEMTAQDAAAAQKRIELDAQLHVSLANNAKIEAERLRIILNENEAMDEQVQHAMAMTKATQVMAGIKAVPRPGMAPGMAGGAASQKDVNQRAMNMAQLSYAIQDFSTGLAMGNFNMAVMGASNNLGMMAQSIGPVAGGLTVIAAALLPHAIKALDEWEGHAGRAILQTKALSKAFDEFRDSLSRQHKVMENTFQIENMENAETGIDRLKKINNERVIATKLEADRVNKIKELKQSIKGVGIEQNMIIKGLNWAEGVLGGTGGATPGATRVMTQEAILEVMASINKLEEERKTAHKDELDRIQEEIAARKKLLDVLQPKFATGLRGDIRAELGGKFVSAREHAAKELDARLKDIQRNAAEADKDELSDKAREVYRMKRKEADQDEKMAKKRLELEMKPFSTTSEHAKLRAEENYQKRSAEIRDLHLNPQEESKMMQDSLNKRNFEIKQAGIEEERNKRHLNTSLIAGINKDAGEKIAIYDRLKDRFEQIEKLGGTPDEQKRLRELASGAALHEFSQLGPKTAFSGIAELSKSIQSGIDDQSIQYASQTAKNTADMKITTDDMLDAIKNLNLGFQ